MQSDNGGQQPRAKLFLSCAAADEVIGRTIAEGLGTDYQVFYWQVPSRGGWFIDLIEKSINSADLFLAILSPSSLDSYWCIQERMLALQREAQLKKANPGATFIHVAKVVEMLPTNAGFFSSYNWIDMTSAKGITSALDHLRGLSGNR